MHLRAGEAHGHTATCGVKIGHHTEVQAERMAAKMAEKTGQEMESYPCFFCMNWHIGRKITDEERERFSTARDTPSSSLSTEVSDPQADRWWD